MLKSSYRVSYHDFWNPRDKRAMVIEATGKHQAKREAELRLSSSVSLAACIDAVEQVRPVVASCPVTTKGDSR